MRCKMVVVEGWGLKYYGKTCQTVLADWLIKMCEFVGEKYEPRALNTHYPTR